MDTWSSNVEDDSTVGTVSLGMVVIDEIHLPKRSPLIDVAGGSGAYATLGSRLFKTPARSKTVGCLALVGYDFPDAVREQLQAWRTTLHENVSHDRLSTRGLLEYEDDTFGPKSVWLPPYYEPSAVKVIDPTGGGNTYLGGFIAGWKASGDIHEASMYGNVAASFAIEQIGLPSCEVSDGEEIWNGTRVMERLAEYRARLSSTGKK
ncbi:hypothetical protein J4E93_010095 [Alternaria ventricosa]|uniref:uncharacterized protein n=1 Tax=Alternaria ventricosa TaxID=1187951 RepID=UPI0020C41501|nr:uncharacterized protein J4E93_010095 [Alternaria ventricosa]KAI4638540.1 hypothetical protein J4E93_010095 [Alternaria ventricosa]